MKKDVIYIDIEDDITSIIEKIKGAQEKIVALVPPKRVGALQSAVNLKLLQKAAGSVDKRVVLITSDVGLSTLAAGVSIPVAKNLQTPPKILPIAAVEPDETDIINGEDLSIGELAQTSSVSAAIAGEPASNINEAAQAASSSLGAAGATVPTAITADKVAAAKKAKTGISGKIPNFDTFRKKLFIFGGLGILLISFLVWALFFAASTTVVITAKTSSVNIAEKLTLDANLATDFQLGRIKPEIKQIKKTVSTEFDTTGTKEIGNRAKGTVTLTNSDGQAITIPGGTVFSAQNLQFTSDNSVTVPGATVCQRNVVCSGKADVTITAASVGPEYNIPAQAYSTSEDVDATGQATVGGSKETVNVVAAADVEKAKAQLKSQDETSVRQELNKQFNASSVVIQESFTFSAGDPNVTPAVGEQAKRAKLSAETTYILIGLPRTDVDDVLNDRLNQQITDKTGRRIYSNGSKTLKFSQFQPLEGGIYSAQLTTTGYIGPTINEQKLKERISGKRYGEIEQIVNNIEGVENVEIDFSPFWVSKAPAAEDVTIKFTVKNNAN